MSCSESTVLPLHVLWVLQLLRQEGGWEEGPEVCISMEPFYRPRDRSEFETPGRQAQATLSGELRKEKGGQASPPTAQVAPPQGSGCQHRLLVQGPWPSSLGR